jgi:hypothetical protein
MFTKATRLAIIVNVVAAVFIFSIAATDSAIYPVSAQTNNSNTNNRNMMLAMSELAKLHLMVADQALMQGNTTAAFNQMNLAYLQLAMLGMKDMATLNETQAMKFIQGTGKVSNNKMVPDNCIIIQGGVLACRDILTGSYSLAR